MQGTCSCGGRLKEMEHAVTTESGVAQHGLDCPPPVIVERTECRACGRSETRFFAGPGQQQTHPRLAQ